MVSVKKGCMKMMLVLALLGFLNASVYGQAINATFRLNTATNSDTLQAYHFVQIRGSLNGWAGTGPILPDGKTIAWDATSSLIMENLGGDYWEATFQMNPEDTLLYKFWTGFDDQTGTTFWAGWEGPIDPWDDVAADTRIFISGSSDTTLPLQYNHNTDAVREQYWTPFEQKEDTLAVYFRVNMGGVTEAAEFDPVLHAPVGVRGGSETSGGMLSWNAPSSVVLERETASVNDGSFWSGVVYIPKAAVTEGTVQEYMFWADNKPIAWENIGGVRTYECPAGLEDTTLQWVYFDNKKPTGIEPVTSTVIFRLNLEALENIGLFDRGVGDKVLVIGPKGWDPVNQGIAMNFVPALQEWVAQESFTLLPGTKTDYLYYIQWDPSRFDSSSANFIPWLNSWDGWEESGLSGGLNRSFIFQDAAEQSPDGDLSRDVQYFDGVPGQAVVAGPIQVTFTIDMRPAADAATNPEWTLFRPGIDTAYVQFDGSFFAVALGLAKWGDNSRIMLSDPDADGIYSAVLDIAVPNWYQICYMIAYTTGDGVDVVNWHAGGQYGRRYYQFIHPDQVNADGSVVWPSSFDLPAMEWKNRDIPCDIETPPDLFTPTAVSDGQNMGPDRYDLEPNFPNPFNPQTTVAYRLAQTSHAVIAVYDVAGRLVTNLVDREQPAGQHTIVWNGDDQSGRPVSSGIYILAMKAGGFEKRQKMVLVH